MKRKDKKADSIELFIGDLNNQCSGVSTQEQSLTTDELTEEQKAIAWSEYLYQLRMLELENQ